VEWNFMDGEGEQDEFNNGNEEGTSSEGEETEILTIKDEERVQKVVVKKEPRTSQFLTIQDEECNHTKGLDSLIKLGQAIAVGPADNNYVGTEWIKTNGLKVIVRQGDLVEVEAEVIVNPANSELCHGGGAARAISSAAGK